MYRKTASTSLPVDSAQWGELMQAELVNRLPRISGLIERFKLLHSDEEGNGIGVFFLEGGRVFVPVVATEWKIQPIDTVVYKSDNKTEMGFLCERNILGFMTSPSLGTAGSKGNRGTFDSYVNLFSPAGGYGDRTTNPYSSSYGNREKSASILAEMADDLDNDTLAIDTTEGKDYGLEVLKNESFLNHFPELREYVDVSSIGEDMGNFLLIERDEDSYTIYDKDAPDGEAVDADYIRDMLNAIPDPEVRQSKTASLLSGAAMTTMGRVSPSKEMIFLDPTNMAESIKGQKSIPLASDGTYFVGGILSYVNPNVIYVDGTFADKHLIVQPGSCYLAEDPSCIDSTNSVDSSQLSKNEFMPVAQQLRSGDIICIENKRNREITVPLTVLLPVEDKNGQVTSFTCQPTEGNPGSVTIKWYSGVKIIDEGDVIRFPYYESTIYHLPPVETEEDREFSRFRSQKPVKQTVVQFAKGGGSLFSVTEDDRFLKNCPTKGEFLYFIIKRYGLGKKQAIEVMKKVFAEKNVSIVLQKNNYNVKNSSLDVRVKEAIDMSIQLARRLMKVAAGPAAPNQQQAQAQAQQQAQQQAQGGGGNADPAAMQGKENVQQADANAKGSLTEKSVMQTKTLSHLAQEVIEMLTYYATGAIKKEELSSLFNSIGSKLREIEGDLSKVLLLAQLKKIKGVEYSETKMMLSDIDNYLSRVESARALGASN